MVYKSLYASSSFCESHSLKVGTKADVNSRSRGVAFLILIESLSISNAIESPAWIGICVYVSVLLSKKFMISHTHSTQSYPLIIKKAAENQTVWNLEKRFSRIAREGDITGSFENGVLICYVWQKQRIICF